MGCNYFPLPFIPACGTTPLYWQCYTSPAMNVLFYQKAVFGPISHATVFVIVTPYTTFEVAIRDVYCDTCSSCEIPVLCATLCCSAPHYKGTWMHNACMREGLLRFEKLERQPIHYTHTQGIGHQLNENVYETQLNLTWLNQSHYMWIDAPYFVCEDNV